MAITPPSPGAFAPPTSPSASPDGATAIKLNLGCGNYRRPGWLNVDISPISKPDQIWDLEQLPWPWPDNCADEVLLNHVLEHLGQTPAAFLGIMKELYRVCRHEAKVAITVPHPRHDYFLADPTHVRAVTPYTLALFDRKQNEQWIGKVANSPLGLQCGVDFELTGVTQAIDEKWMAKLQKGEITQEQLNEACELYNNVVKETRMTLRVRKA